MTSRPGMMRLQLAVLGIALQSVTFASTEQPQRAPRSVHRSRQNCDQQFSARAQVHDLQAAAVSVPPPAGGGSAHDDAPPFILPATVFVVAAETARLLTPETPDGVSTRRIAAHAGRGPPVLS